jgi:uncharacterized membrane protein YhaH (DUF805 family)/uncharacterized membrane protein YphA (DoxX/SURF4 family)
MKNLILIARVVFGVWMLANGVNHFFFHLYPEPVGHEPLAIQLITALQHSRLFDVAMAIQLVAGVLVLAGVILPVALCVVTPVNVCAVFWALILDHNPAASLLALAALALNGLLMLAYIDYYKDMLVRRALTFGETEVATSWNPTFAWATGRTSRVNYIKALIPLILAAAFYTVLAKTGRNGEWVLATLLYPGFVLVAGRLHDMGQTAWLLLAPGLVTVIALWLHFFADPKAALTVDVGVAAYVVCIAFLVWGLVWKGQDAANRFGEPAAA